MRNTWMSYPHDIDFTTRKLHVRRAKGGTTSVHPIGGRELRALRRLKRETLSHCLPRGLGQAIVPTRGSTLKGVGHETSQCPLWVVVSTDRCSTF